MIKEYHAASPKTIWKTVTEDISALRAILLQCAGGLMPERDLRAETQSLQSLAVKQLYLTASPVQTYKLSIL